MEIKNQAKEIAKYFKNYEKDEEQYCIGVEFEHFIVNKDNLKSISYYGNDGVEDTLKKLLSKGWNGKYEGEHLLGLNRGATTVTLEPGSQIELSIKPHENIEEVEKEYRNFLDEITPILAAKNQTLIATGYQPVSKINDIMIIPKQRYSYMFDYFKNRGKFAHNMMKGTASVQISVDYKSEEDYAKKFKIANALSPVMYALFDNSPIFEGEISEENCLRAKIWENCDDVRCGIVDGVFEDSYGYEAYATYLLNRPPIFTDNGKTIEFTGNKLYKELFNKEKYSVNEIEHVMTMVFPDVRTKKYVEIRMMDAIPYPLNFAVVALWKGILYDASNLDKVYEFIKTIKLEEFIKAKKDIVKNGINTILNGKPIYEIGRWLVELSKTGLSEQERQYLLPLEIMIDKRIVPSQITKDRLTLGKTEALKWCFISNEMFRGDRTWIQ